MWFPIFQAYLTAFLVILRHVQGAGNVSSSPSGYDSAFTRQLLAASSEYGNFSGVPTKGPIKVGIIGSGAAGLYSALLLKSLGIEYDILEADSRPGGRIWTHYFNRDVWSKSRPGDPAYYDYVDIGAMRIPLMPYMDRIVGNQDYSLINFVNKHVPPREQIRMIPYIYDANNTFLLYNNVLRKYQDPMSGDPFRVGSTSDGAVPANFAALDPTKVWGEAIKEFTDALSHSFEDGFKKLMAFDSISVRKYLQDKNYTHAEIDWLEAFGDSTGNYNAALSEQVIEAWIFTAASSWTTIEGGFSRLINGMLNCIRKPVRFAQRVVKISYAADRSLLVSTEKGMTFQYSHVINTAPLGAVQAMDMTKLDLEYDKVTAIRGLNYDASTKIGIKFKTRWWQDLPASIVGGESLSDLLIRHCVYPSYGVDTEHAAAAMIASYTWGQDAERLSGYLSTARGRSELIELTLKDLEKMNGLEEGYLRSQYVESFAFSWNDSPYALGAFALFSPGQFSSRLPSLLKPAAEGRLHFAGEALSSGHGWIIGALNSAYRAVAEILAREGRTDLLEQLSAQWGTIDEIDMGWYSHSAGENVKPPTSAPPPPAR